MTEQLVVDDLAFEVNRSTRRKTVELIVDRGGELRISAPPKVGKAWLEKFVREKRFWLYTKLAEKEALLHPVVERQFVNGEGFPYLGRSYRLLLVDGQDEPLKLKAGRFCLGRMQAKQGRETFTTWYASRAQEWLSRRLRDWTTRMAVEPKSIEVRDLGFRWGSCSKSGTINFHWATILLPPSVIDYVIVHELAHLNQLNHTPEFWKLVERAMPDYTARKDWIASHGASLLCI